MTQSASTPSAARASRPFSALAPARPGRRTPAVLLAYLPHPPSPLCPP